jgi:DNA-binding beta-propeller fold protein YncE
VNGIAAAIIASSAPGAQSGSPASKGFASTLSEDESAEEGSVDWEVEVDLGSGENTLVVEIEDVTGDVTENADTAEVRYAEAPTQFTLDAERARVVGLSPKIMGFGSRLVAHDYTSLEQTVIADTSSPWGFTCFRGRTDQLLRLVLVDDDTWELHGFDIATGQGSIITSIPPQAIDPGAGFLPTPYFGRLVCGDDHDHAYALANYVAEDGIGFGSSGFAKSRILRIALFPPYAVTPLTETDVTESPRWLSKDIALEVDRMVSLQDLNPDQPLTAVSLADGGRSVLTPNVPVGGLALAPALDQGVVYVATFAGIDKIELDPPSKTNISEVEPGDPLTFTQVSSVAYDVANGRLIVGDTDLDALIAIDAITGERTDFVSRRIGAGPPVIAPRRIELRSDMSTAYVIDDGGNAAQRLFAIDLASGDRVQIGDIDTAIVYLRGLALDEVNERVFVSGIDSIIEVSLEDGSERVIARPESVMVGSLIQSIGTLAFDAPRNRLLVGDFGRQAVVAIDLDANAQQSIFSQLGVRGEGEAGFATIAAISLDAQSDVAYVANQLNETILRVDLETGDRELLITACPKTQQETLGQVLYDSVRDELLIVNDGLYVHKLGTGACNEVPLSVPLKYSLLGVQVTPDNRLLGSILRSVLQIDRRSGDAVILSR